MNKTLTVIIPVSKHESISTIQKSIDLFELVDFYGFDERIVYAIDVPDDKRPYDSQLVIPDNMEILWVTDTSLKQASAYNAGLEKYPNSDYYAFFDADAVPETKFFSMCAQVGADFVSCDRYVLYPYQNRITETISEEYEFCNAGRRFMHKYIGNYFPASCTGLIEGIVLRDFRFTETTSADSELYRHILSWGFSMGYAHGTQYIESAPHTREQLYSQRLRWLSDTWRTCIMTVGSGNSWNVNISNFLMHLVGMFPILGCIALIPYAKHFNGYNFISHSLYMQYISLVGLKNVISGEDVKWDGTDR